MKKLFNICDYNIKLYFFIYFLYKNFFVFLCRNFDLELPYLTWSNMYMSILHYISPIFSFILKS